MKDQRYKNEPGKHFPIDPESPRGKELRDIIHRLGMFLGTLDITHDPSGSWQVDESDLMADARYEALINMAIECLGKACPSPASIDAELKRARAGQSLKAISDLYFNTGMTPSQFYDEILPILKKQRDETATG